MHKTIIFALITALSTTATAEPRVDASTDEKLQASLTKMYESVPAGSKKKLEDAIQNLVYMDFFWPDRKYSNEQIEANLRERLTGRTATALIELSEQLIAEQKILRSQENH
ncbi:hypothetical protein [Neptunomonas marina]|uniref:Uncharacterized protein n=1 Tax=Neptunomonas marina TaxID=1815562 RepID=A0A437Q901_9GAMM|nr:hypothetical protein [Neptunomonas marina]RVU30985.1 hypothetical protein EOE65_08200 [Neptunomonas marina]